MMRAGGLLVAAVTAALVAAAPAQGATTIGETFTSFTQGCTPPAATPATWLQATSPSGQYSSPTAGVITSWSIQMGATVPSSLKFKVANATGGGYTPIVGESDPVAPVADTLNIYNARISVPADSVIGFSVPANSGSFMCMVSPADGYGIVGSLQEDAAPGSSFFGYPFGASKMALSAELEPDADKDGYGDETQDGCPGDPAAQAPPCADPPPPPPPPTTPPPANPVEPDTAVSRQAKAKVRLKGRKRRAEVSFAFSSATAGATFECSLDGGSFATCASPAVYRLRKGKHTLSVRAVADALTDSSPATAAVKVKRRKRNR